MGKPTPQDILRQYFNEPPAGATDFGLMGAVQSNDVAKVRDWLDFAFHRGWKARPAWEHMLVALKNDNRDMLRLLAAWNVRPAEADMQSLRSLSKNKYQGYVRQLRMAGVPLSAEMMRDIPFVPPTPAEIAAKIPNEWRHLLRMIQKLSSAEAVIAGGALRDIANGAAVKDVDIFIPDNEIVKHSHRDYLWMFFNCAGINVHAQEVSSGDAYSFTEHTTFRKTGKGEVAFVASDVYNDVIERRVTESWKVIAGDQHTEYNIVFVKPNFPSHFSRPLINGFDIGLCQIAYDGQKVETTSAYDHDVANNTITLRHPNEGSREHLQRLIKKYPDWTLDDNAKALLSPPPKKSRNTGLVGPH